MHQGLGSADWTLVTVTYNSADHLRACWSDGPPGEATWLVIDNNSTDDTVAVAKELGAAVTVLDENVGFSKANNVGLRQVTTAWVAFVNPDVIIHDEKGLERLARIAQANRGLVAPQLLNLDGSEQPNARGLPYPLRKIAHRAQRLPGVRIHDYARTGFTAPVFVAWVMGAALTGATRDFRELGGWDERFFLYYEDHDIGLRAWSAGMNVVVDPLVRWTHGWQRETRRFRVGPWRHEVRSATSFYRKYPALLSEHSARETELFTEVRAHAWQYACDV